MDFKSALTLSIRTFRCIFCVPICCEELVRGGKVVLLLSSLEGIYWLTVNVWFKKRGSNRSNCETYKSDIQSQFRLILLPVHLNITQIDLFKVHNIKTNYVSLFQAITFQPDNCAYWRIPKILSGRCIHGSHISSRNQYIIPLLKMCTA